MRLGILSDTHISTDLKILEDLVEALQDCDHLLHAGDYTSFEALEALRRHRGFIGVRGNADLDMVRQQLKDKEIIVLEGYRLGLIHGDGLKKTTVERAMETFKDDEVDIIVFGHSHQPLIQTKKDILLLNPGSPTNKRREKYYSYMILELGASGIEARLCLKAYK